MIQKKLLIPLVLILSSTPLMAQLFGAQNLVSEDMKTVIYRVQSGDFDTDGDADIIFYTTDNVFWMENIDGNGTFTNEHIIDTAGFQTFSQHLTDLDMDGKLDILISYFETDQVVWYRNLGNGVFTAAQILASNLNDASGIIAGDIDDDGDLDIVLGVSNGNGLYWKEHLDGNGTFGARQTISPNITQARTQQLGDLDGDGDLDIVTNGLGTERLSWFENIDGQGDFSIQHIIETSGLYENFFELADLDGDDDLDIVSSKDKSVIWRENTDGLGTFGSPTTLFTDTITPPGVGGFGNIQLVDLDNDGDIDITYDSPTAYGKIYQLNTNGTGVYSTPEFIQPPKPNGTTSFNFATDIDGDGDIDLLNSSYFPDTDLYDQYWYENTTILGVASFDTVAVRMTPNPVDNKLSITTDMPIQKVSFHQMLGPLVKTVTSNFKDIDVNALAAGMYLVLIETEEMRIIRKLVKK